MALLAGPPDVLIEPLHQLLVAASLDLAVFYQASVAVHFSLPFDTKKPDLRLACCRLESFDLVGAECPVDVRRDEYLPVVSQHLEHGALSPPQYRRHLLLRAPFEKFPQGHRLFDHLIRLRSFEATLALLFFIGNSKP